MDRLTQALIFGLATGGVIAVAAVGLTLAYSVTGFINFAYGELLTVAAYCSYAATQAGAALIVAGVVGVVAAGVLSVLVAGLFFEPLRNRGPLPLLITSVGVAFVVQSFVQIIFGTSPEPFPVPLLRPWEVGTVFVPKLQVAIFLIALACMLAVYALLRTTLLGRKMRATAGNHDLALVSGINSRRVVRMTWLVSGLIAGLGGVLLAGAQGTIHPTMGFKFLLVVFAATLLGGIGNPYGAMSGAIVIGLGIELGATYVSADYATAIAFLTLVLVLLVRPGGIYANPSQRTEPA